MKLGLRQRAIALRQKGWSYSVIKSRVGVSKSTLSHWLRHIPYRPNQAILKRIKEGTAKSNAARHRLRVESIAAGRKLGHETVQQLTERDLLMLGLGVYIGEGSKLYEDVAILNSDPEIVRLAMRWFRKIFKVPEQNFSIALHIYPDTSEKAAMSYWSKVTDIPFSQFRKTYVDRRTNKSNKKSRKLPYGTAHIKVRACGKPEFGVHLHRRVMGLIEAVYLQNAGIV